MKRLVYAPAALTSLEAILLWTIEQFGDAQAERYTKQLVARLEALALDQPPRAKSCKQLLQGKRDATGLSYYREGQHYLILRESEQTLELVEVFHSRMDLETKLMALKESGDTRRSYTLEALPDEVMDAIVKANADLLEDTDGPA